MSNEKGNGKNESGIRGKITPPPPKPQTPSTTEKFGRITTPPPKPPTKKGS
jgi:hypothetical protein